MVTIFLRTLLVYVIMIFAMRLMGKRQIGELEVSDLVTTLLISEIASLPITDYDLPFSRAIIPIILLITLEITSSILTVLFPKLKNLFTARPSTLIKNGVFCRSAMIESRISADELISELRQNGYVDVDEILYAILEKNGKITIIPKTKYATPTCEQLSVVSEERGIFHIVIDNGCINLHGLDEVGLTRDKLIKKLSALKKTPADVYLMMISDNGEERIIYKKEPI